MTTNSISPRDIPHHLLEKYHRSGPRYTSYPTAPQFKTDFDSDDIVERWLETNDSPNGLSLYFHFPFCKSRCLYCGCYTLIGESTETKSAYIDTLIHELDRIFTIIEPERKIRQMAFGGGTPTFLPPKFLEKLLIYIEKNISFAPNAERSIEIDPRSVDENYLELLINLGFNRFSFGVQDLNPVIQKNINRVFDTTKLINLMDFLGKRNALSINLDLIYGLPGQTPESFGSTIDKIIMLKPSRIALFGYAHVPWISPHQKTMEKHGIPSPPERIELFGRAFELLLDAGYSHVGMDHFALPHDELLTALNNHTLTRNFMGYTTHRGLDLLGIGASSISSVGSTYTQNVKEIAAYLSNPCGLHWQKALALSSEDILRKEIIMDLFCNFYLDTTAVSKKFVLDFHRHFAQELDTLRTMEEDGLLQIENQAIIVTPLGRFFIRNICMPFDQYLAKENTNPEKRYSKTI
jgi:oxygen-independent coproporphyrinogen III oxidase